MSSVDQSQVERGRRAAGHGAEPRRLARHGADRRGADLGLTTGFISRVETNPAVTPAVAVAARAGISAGIPVVPVDDVEQALLDANVPAAEATAVAEDYGDAQLEALKKSLLAVALLAAGALVFTRRLPGHPTGAAAATPVADA